MELVIYLVIGYLCLLSMIGFILMGVDKRRARRKAWRISERTLILVAFLGGGLGSLLGMYAFHHKTKHIKFRILIPIATVFSLLLAYQLIRS